MADQADRIVVEVRRRVPEEDLGRYDPLWISLRDATAAAGSHAWRFRLRTDPGTFIEFLEFRAGADPRDRSDVADLMRMLDRIAPGSVEEFVDASPSREQEG